MPNSRNLTVVIVGNAGTGKTALAHTIAEHLKFLGLNAVCEHVDSKPEEKVHAAVRALASAKTKISIVEDRRSLPVSRAEMTSSNRSLDDL